MHILKMKKETWIIAVMFIVLVLGLILFWNNVNSHTKNSKGELTYSHIKINSLEVIGDGYCYKGGNSCYKVGCDYCDEHPDDCRVIMNYDVGLILPNNANSLDCKKKVYIDGAIYEPLSDTPYHGYTDSQIKNDIPFSLGSIPHSNVKFEICCNNGDGKDVCISETRDPIC